MKSRVYLLNFLFFLSFLSFGQSEDETNLDEVTINYNKKTSKVSFLGTQNITTLSSDELLKAACCNLAESFETTPSIDVNFSDAISGSKQIKMLGLSSPNILISIENIPSIRGALQSHGLNYIPGTWIESIQITKGIGSVVNGYESITGQINAELRKPINDEVLIEHTAIGLNYIDTYHRSGLYPLTLPSELGMEASGIIKEVGPDVSNFSVGDKVAYAALPLGAYSTHRIFKTNNLVKVPDDIDLTLAATLMTKGLTTFYLLHKTYPASPGETVLFHAAAGGVGQIFCQWAKSIGVKIIGTVGNDEKVELAKKNGCDEVINYSKEDFAKKVMKLTDGKGLPVVYDGVGKSTFEKSLECLKTRGTMVSFGNASGSLEPIDVTKMLQPKGLFFVRPSLGQYLTSREELNEASKVLFEKISSGKVKVEIFKKYKLEDVRQAHLDLEARKITGPAIIVP